jgi:TRAP-type C4-dicarboxylate transport system permease small subunit
VGIAILVIGALAIRIIPMSINNWTASVGFPLATTGLIGALFLVLAVIRWLRVHVAK